MTDFIGLEVKTCPYRSLIYSILAGVFTCNAFSTLKPRSEHPRATVTISHTPIYCTDSCTNKNPKPIAVPNTKWLDNEIKQAFMGLGVNFPITPLPIHGMK